MWKDVARVLGKLRTPLNRLSSYRSTVHTISWAKQDRGIVVLACGYPLSAIYCTLEP